MKTPPLFEIKATAWWVKPIEMLVHNWALIEQTPENKAIIYFFHDQGKTKGDGPKSNPYKYFHQSNGYIAVIDSLAFVNMRMAIQGLKKNGFRELANDDGPWVGGEPSGQYYDARKYEGGIYSKAGYWIK